MVTAGYSYILMFVACVRERERKKLIIIEKEVINLRSEGEM